MTVTLIVLWFLHLLSYPTNYGYEHLEVPGDLALDSEEGNKHLSDDKVISLDRQSAIFYANCVASYWALQRFVDGVLLLPQLIWADDTKKIDLCIHFFASNDWWEWIWQVTELDPKYNKVWLRMGDTHNIHIYSYTSSLWDTSSNWKPFTLYSHTQKASTTTKQLTKNPKGVRDVLGNITDAATM